MNPKVSTNTLCYLAGYFDGEGSIWVSVRKDSFSLGVSLHTGDKKCIELFKEVFGGNVYLGKPVQTATWKTNRQVYKWQASGQRAQEIIRALRPYLLSDKAEVADLALQFNIRKRGQRMTEDERTLRLGLATQIHAINQRVTVQ